MFTRIDHVMICVPELTQAVEQYRKLGFNIYPGGAHPGRGTHNAIAFNDDASYDGYQQLGRTSPRVQGATGARLIKGRAFGRAQTPVRVFDLLARSKGHVAVHRLIAVSQPDAKRVPVQDILNSLRLSR